MTFEFTTVLLALFAVLAGMLDATVGGSGLILIPFLVFTGDSIQLAIGTSRLIFLMDSFSAMLGHAAKKNIDWKLAAYYSIPSMLAAPVGAYVTSVTSSEVISKLFGVFMLAMLALILARPGAGVSDKRSMRVFPSVLAGFGIGFMIGLLGGGVGILIIMALVFVSGTTMLLASGTSQVIVWMTNIVALAAYYNSGLVDVKTGFILGVMAFLGAQLGVVVAHKAGNRWLKILLAVLSLASALKLLL